MPVPDDVEMLPVSSSNIAAVGYNKPLRELYVTFHSGATYAYDEVPSSTYDDLLTAQSPGQYLNRWVKGRHSARRI